MHANREAALTTLADRQGAGDTGAGRAVGRSRSRRVRIDPLLAVCALALVGFPLAVTLAASRAPVVPRAPALLPPLTGSQGAGATVADVPVLTAGGPAAAAVGGRILADPARLRRAIRRSASKLLRPEPRRRLMGMLGAELVLPAPAGVPYDRYPYSYRGLDGLLDRVMPRRPSERQAAAWSDLAGLLVLASAAEVPYVNAGQIAFAVLHRARSEGACAPQLNLSHLVAASSASTHAAVSREFAAAVRACPGDPTPAWLAGQWESVYAPEAPRLARTRFRALQRRLPGSAAGWAGEGDHELRQAYIEDEGGRRFTARSRFRRALALYRRAQTLDPDPRLDAGVARALAGLGQHGRAAALDRAVLAVTAPSAWLQARLVRDLEEARRFADAAAAAADLASFPRFPREAALFFVGTDHIDPTAVLAEQDGLTPLSLGAGRLAVRTFDIQPRHHPVGVKPVVFQDLSFLPLFRDDALTRIDPWCASWSARRDLVAAGRARRALQLAPSAALRGRDGAICGRWDDPGVVAAIRSEAGEGEQALAGLTAAGLPRRRARGVIAERRQNFWRFAGRLDRAADVAASWVREMPREPLAADRAGEVAFLQGRYEEAARLFARSARLLREQVPGWSSAEADNVVKAGVALARAGRREDARRILAAGDEVATRAMAQRADDRAYWRGDPIGPRVIAYSARAQAGDLELRAGRYAAADEAYAAAREVVPHGAAAQLVRPEAVDGNRAVVQMRLGRPRAAVRLARRALRPDPRNPLSLSTLGNALLQAGRNREAAGALRRALREDVTLFPAWNDLGVALARSGRRLAAVSALERAVGIRRSYALGWFNLGVVLSRGSLRDLPAAEGALARARRLDEDLAGRQRRLLADDHVYFVDLDVSKPLPPRWSFASDVPQTPMPAAGLAFAFLLAVGLARGVAGRGLPGGTAKWLSALRLLLSRLPRFLAGFGSGAVAAAATVAVFTWPALRDQDRSLFALLPLVAGVILVIAMVARARVLAARRAGVRLHQRSWRPALGIAVAGGAVGVPWAPLPVALTDRPVPAVHRSGPLVAACTGLVLVVLGAWLDVLATEATGAAAIAMAATLLTPVAPFDGGRLGGVASTAAGFGLLALAILALLGLS